MIAIKIKKKRGNVLHEEGLGGIRGWEEIEQLPKGCVTSPGAVPCHRKQRRCGRGCGRGHGTAPEGTRTWKWGMQTGGSWHLYLISLGQQEKPSGQFNQEGIPLSGFHLLK